MEYKGIDIYRCKIFTIDKENGKLKFFAGRFKGRSAEDINTLTDLHAVIGHCFWMINKTKEPFPLCSRYAASAFLKEVTPKLVLLEEKMREVALEEQKRLIKETEESAKKTGTKYI